MPLRFIFVDFDSYFASCEQQLRPELRGQPVGVVPMMAETTCCLAASYEAKAFGVRTGTGVREARTLCPGIRFVVAEHKPYVEIHNKLKSAVEELCIPDIHIKSIDEFYAELPPNWRNEQAALRLADNIRRVVREVAGEYIGCTIGFGPNIFLAKLGSGMNKPRGLNLIRERDLPQALHGLDLTDIYGVGWRMQRRLRARGIYTVAQLCEASREKLRAIWGGVEGERMYAELRGEIVERGETTRRQVTHSHVLPPRIRNRDDAFAVCHRLTQKAAMRLRHLDYYAARYHVGLRLLDGTRWGAETTFYHTQRTPVFLESLRRLWKGLPRDAEPMQVYMALGELVPANLHTPSLFSGGWDVRGEAIEKAMDTINRKMGPRTVYYGGAHDGMDEAPMRIAFTHIPDLEVERD